ncbi:MAG TPA: DoxX family membrane protein [Povalibacter sp.]
MNRNMIPYVLGALIVGVVGVLVGDFALQWQPVPEGVPLRTPLAYVSAILLIGSAVSATLSANGSRLAALVLGLFYLLWVLLLHTPRVAAHPADLGIWLGLAESMALTVGGLLAWNASAPEGRPAYARAGQILFGACLLLFGSTHFVYADFSAGMIPKWMPAPMFWVYLTGCGHVAAGLSIMSGIASRLAATLLTAMMGCFVLLLHIPRVLADPGNRVEWTMLGMSIALTGAAWLVRSTVTPQSMTTSQSVVHLPA